MTGAILTAIAAAGFWTVGHWQAAHYPSLEACERARPHVEAAMSAHGCTGIFTRCREVKGRP
jgi:hypothetical protein